MKNDLSDRRQFIKDSSKYVGAGFLLSSFPFTNSLGEGIQKEKLGVALVGLGNYSTTQLGPALKEASNCYLSGIVTGTPAKAEKWSKEYNIPEKNIYNYKNYDDIANNDDIDIIYVVLPNSMHAEYTIRTLEAGKHVICEKPMALNATDAKKMIDTAKKVNRKLSIGYRLHFDPYNKEMMRLGQNEVFGPVNYMECSLGYSFTPEIGSWKLKKSMGGGSLYNLGVYPIQGARYTKGAEPVFVTAQATTKRKDIFVEIDEIFTWQLEFADGTLCNSYSGPAAYISRLFAGCTNGNIELDPAYGYDGQAGSSPDGIFDFPHVFQQKLQIEDFVKCIQNGEESRVSGVEGWKDMLVIDAIHESIKTGQRVKIQES